MTNDQEQQQEPEPEGAERPQRRPPLRRVRLPGWAWYRPETVTMPADVAAHWDESAWRRA